MKKYERYLGSDSQVTHSSNFYLWIINHYLPPDRNEILKAWYLVSKYQGHQFRRDNTPVLFHLEMTAQFMWRWDFPAKYIVAALLHDIVEDCKINLRYIRKEFGTAVARMVSFMSRNKLSGFPDYDSKVKNWLKKEPKLAFLRLADEWHNLLNFEGYRNLESLHDNCREALQIIKAIETLFNDRDSINYAVVENDLQKIKLKAQQLLKT